MEKKIRATFPSIIELPNRRLSRFQYHQFTKRIRIGVKRARVCVCMCSRDQSGRECKGLMRREPARGDPHLRG